MGGARPTPSASQAAVGFGIAALSDILDALADNVRGAIDGIDWDIQVEPWLVINPTPVTVDIFPGNPPEDPEIKGFGDVVGGKTTDDRRLQTHCQHLLQLPAIPRR